MIDLQRELARTRPDYVVYVPASADGSTHDTGNEHFLVFDGPDGSLMAVWTQSTFEGRPDQRVVFSRSPDEGRSWEGPKVLAGAMAGWQFPMVSRSGRIYVLYSRHVGVNDVFTHTTGLMAGIYSDDAGATFSPEQIIPMPPSRWDNPDPAVPANWIVWQKPLRLSEGKYFVGFTRWVSPAVRHAPPVDHWTGQESVVEFMRFENLDDDPAPGDLAVSYFAGDDEALRVGFRGHPEVSVAQEPAVVPLPDGRLFVVMRTAAGSPYYSVSGDGGERWSQPKVLRQYDDAPALLHPCSPCPMYTLSPGRYIFLYHNHDGHFRQWGPLDSADHRRPVMVALAEHRPHAAQPVWFSPPKLLMDNDGVRLGAGRGRADLAMYASFTIRHGRGVLWYPERKFFLLGKRIAPAWLADLTVPGAAGQPPGPRKGNEP